MNTVRKLLILLRFHFRRRRIANVALYCRGAIDELRRCGMVDAVGKLPSCTELAAWDQLRASGFRPRLWEVRAFAFAFCGELEHREAEALVWAIANLDRVLERVEEAIEAE